MANEIEYNTFEEACAASDSDTKCNFFTHWRGIFLKANGKFIHLSSTDGKYPFRLEITGEIERVAQKIVKQSHNLADSKWEYVNSLDPLFYLAESLFRLRNSFGQKKDE